MNESEQNEIFNRLREIERRQTVLETTLWGQTGNNGVRSDIAELKGKMDMLLRFFWIATALPPITLTLIGVLKFLGKL